MDLDRNHPIHLVEYLPFGTLIMLQTPRFNVRGMNAIIYFQFHLTNRQRTATYTFTSSNLVLIYSEFGQTMLSGPTNFCHPRQEWGQKLPTEQSPFESHLDVKNFLYIQMHGVEMCYSLWVALLESETRRGAVGFGWDCSDQSNCFDFIYPPPNKSLGCMGSI